MRKFPLDLIFNTHTQKIIAISTPKPVIKKAMSNCQTMMKIVFKLISLFVITFMAQSSIAQDKQCAVVLMHGKWGTTQFISFFGRRLEPVCDYTAIEMPWSKRRNYDAPYLTALAEIKAQVEKFRQQGYKRIVLAGHSFGANAALAYMKTEGDVDGIISLAAGHTPSVMYQRGIGKPAVDKARELVSVGKGDESLSMDDFNQGKLQSIRMRADVLLSYFDPQGLGNMVLTSAQFKKPVPVLWVVGTLDPLYPLGSGYGFDKTPHHEASKYLVVEADHANTPDVSIDQVKEWLKGLP
jgi:pimeloyl-ACP methyl ester carboxylesterase